MPTLAEQWFQQGFQLGLEQAGAIYETRCRIMEILDIRFGAVPAGLSAYLETITNREILDQLFRQAVIAETTIAFNQFLAHIAPQDATPTRNLSLNSGDPIS